METFTTPASTRASTRRHLVSANAITCIYHCYNVVLPPMSSATDERPANDLRTALLETAAHLIATEGSARLTVRRVADEAGTSTMAVYTHFGGMPGLRQAVRREGFARLTAHVAAVDKTDDPLADLARLALAYYENATADPDLYR